MPGEPGVQPQDFNDLGIGDPYLKVGALLYRGVFYRNSFGVFGTIKAPVADETQGFGTGEWDFGLGVGWSRRTAKNLLFLELAYWSLGEPPLTSPSITRLQVSSPMGGRLESALSARGHDLARTSHQLPAAAGDAPHPVVFSHFRVLDVLSSTTPLPSGRKPHWPRHLADLATKAGEKCGLGPHRDRPRG